MPTTSITGRFRTGDILEITFTNGTIERIAIPPYWYSGMNIHTYYTIASYTIINRANREEVEDDGDYEDVDFNNDTGLAGKW